MNIKSFPKKKGNYLNVPVALCFWVVRNKFFSPFQVYLYLKSNSVGQKVIKPSFIKQIAIDLGVTNRTVNNNIAILKEKNWLGYDSNYSYTFIRGFKKVMHIENLNGRNTALLNISKELNDFQIFKAFTIGAATGYLINYKKRKETSKIKIERLGSRSKHILKLLVPSHFPLSCEAYAKIFQCSIRTASQHKKLAAKYGFIHLKKNKRAVVVNNQQLRSAFAGEFKEANPEIAHKVRILEGLLYLQEPDSIKPLIEFKNKLRLPGFNVNQMLGNGKKV